MDAFKNQVLTGLRVCGLVVISWLGLGNRAFAAGRDAAVLLWLGPAAMAAAQQPTEASTATVRNEGFVTGDVFDAATRLPVPCGGQAGSGTKPNVFYKAIEIPVDIRETDVVVPDTGLTSMPPGHFSHSGICSIGP